MNKKDFNFIYNLAKNGDDGHDIHDNYHTMSELYFHRMVLFSLVLKSFKDKAWKSKLHSDCTMWDHYFIVGVTTPEGDYSYHYDMKYWEFFDVPEIDKAPVYDGHEPKDIDRLYSLFIEEDVPKDSYSCREDMEAMIQSVKSMIEVNNSRIPEMFISDKEYTIGGAGTIICRNIDEVRMLKILVLLLEADPDKFDESGLSEKYGFKHFEVSDPFNISNRFSFASKFVLK